MRTVHCRKNDGQRGDDEGKCRFLGVKQLAGEGLTRGGGGDAVAVMSVTIAKVFIVVMTAILSYTGPVRDTGDSVIKRCRVSPVIRSKGGRRPRCR